MKVNGLGAPTSRELYGQPERPETTVRSSTMPEDVRERDAERVKRSQEPQAAREPRVADSDELDRVVELVNELAQRLNVKVLFRKSETTDEVQLEVVNRETGEVVRRVPPDQMVAHLENFSGFEGMLSEKDV